MKVFSNLLAALLCNLSKLRSFLWHGKLILHLMTTGILERSEACLGRERAKASFCRPPAQWNEAPCFCGASRVILHTLFIELQISFQMNTLLI